MTLLLTGILLAGAPMVNWHAHMDMIAGISHSAMVMARGIRHTRSNPGADRSASQGTGSPGTTTSHDDSQRATVDAPSEVEPSKQKGRKMLCETKLKMPVRGAKVALVPSGDMQFTYVNFKPPYKYTTQLGVILKREYPGVVEDKDQDGLVLRKRAAIEWADYFLIEDDLGLTSGDRVLSEFWVTGSSHAGSDGGDNNHGLSSN